MYQQEIVELELQILEAGEVLDTQHSTLLVSVHGYDVDVSNLRQAFKEGEGLTKARNGWLKAEIKAAGSVWTYRKPRVPSSDSTVFNLPSL